MVIAIFIGLALILLAYMMGGKATTKQVEQLRALTSRPKPHSKRVVVYCEGDVWRWEIQEWAANGVYKWDLIGLAMDARLNAGTAGTEATALDQAYSRLGELLRDKHQAVASQQKRTSTETVVEIR